MSKISKHKIEVFNPTEEERKEAMKELIESSMLSEKAQVLKKALSFIYNNNISIVREIYKEEVANYVLEHLTDKAKHYSETYENNTKAWMEFIFDLDKNNTEILINYLFPVNKPIEQDNKNQISLLDQIDEIEKRNTK